MVYFVNQKKHNSTNDSWDNNCHVKATMDEAMHQFHAFMSTYAYGQSDALDFVACSVEAEDGRIIRSEVDDKRGGDQ